MNEYKNINTLLFNLNPLRMQWTPLGLFMHKKSSIQSVRVWQHHEKNMSDNTVKGTRLGEMGGGNISSFFKLLIYSQNFHIYGHSQSQFTSRCKQLKVLARTGKSLRWGNNVGDRLEPTKKKKGGGWGIKLQPQWTVLESDHLRLSICNGSFFRIFMRRGHQGH